MSGICGILRLDGAPADRDELAPVLGALSRRGPDRSAAASNGPCALGHALLATTPEALVEPMPWQHGPTGCLITADVRLDNRDELLGLLGLDGTARVIGDGEIIIHAYLKWGTDCAAQLLGDFAFVIWDPRHQRILGARDQVGMRQLIYHHAPGKLFAWATEPLALLRHSAIPQQLNEARLADYFENLEAFDLTSTFFLDLYRLPPAHAIIVTADNVRIWRYWELQARPALKLADDREYAEAFREVFTQAVAVRMRSPGPVAAMLSGGMDSSAVAAVAARLLKQSGRPALQTFSAMDRDPDCIESAAITAAQGIDHIAPDSLRPDNVALLHDELMRLALSADEPFDTNMTLLRMIYLAAHQAGHKIVLDGGGGDMALASQNMVLWHLRRGRVLRAWREAQGYERFWGPAPGATENFIRSAGRLLIPARLRAARASLRERRHPPSERDTLLSPEFAARINLDERHAQNARHIQDFVRSRKSGLALRQVHPYLVVGRERYDRIAAAMAIEPRDPFADRRLIEFCTSLPEEQFEDGGWPKIILRRASAGLVPDPVRWRLGKEHLGGLFNDVLWRSDIAALDASQLANLQSYVSGDTLTNTLESGRTGSAWDSTVARLLALRYGSTWLKSISSATR